MHDDVTLSPTVSVILSVFNGEKYLHEAIESILNQTLTDFEFIIINDGSTDNTSDILERFHDQRIVRVHHQSNQGLIASLNDGLCRASGQFIARHDADDICLPDRLEEQVRLLKENPRLVIVGSSFYRINEAGMHMKTVTVPLHDTDIRWTMLFECAFAHNAVMVRTETLRRHGLQYDGRMLHAEDYDLWSRLLLYGDGRNIAYPLVKRRRHTRQISKVFVAEQVVTADGIAWSNLQRLGVSLSKQDVRMLRSWLWNPRLSTNQDIQIGRQFLEILEKFGDQQFADPQRFAEICYRYVNTILAVMSPKDLVIFQKLQFLGRLFREHSLLVLKHLLKRIISNSRVSCVLRESNQ